MGRHKPDNDKNDEQRLFHGCSYRVFLSQVPLALLERPVQSEAMRMNTLATAVLILMIRAPAVAQTEWVEFASQEDRFTANFPGQPKVTQTTFKSQFGADLPARLSTAPKSGASRYSLTVVDYNQVERLLTEKSKACPPGAEACRGNTAATSSTGAGYWKADLAGAVIYATWRFMQRDARSRTWLERRDLVKGHQLQFRRQRGRVADHAAICVHAEQALYRGRAPVPEGYAGAGCFFQQWLRMARQIGQGFRYRSLYHNGFPPPRTRSTWG